MESGISKYGGEDSFLAWQRQDSVTPVCFGDVEFSEINLGHFH